MKPYVKEKITLSAEIIINHSKKMKNKSGIGNMVENNLILALNNGNTKFSFDLKN